MFKVKMEVPFSKYHGAGNDFIMLNAVTDTVPVAILSNRKLIQKICDRHFGVGGDGLIVISRPISDDINNGGDGLIENRFDEEIQFVMSCYNSDGQLASLCGNGSRCSVAFTIQHRLLQNNSLSPLVPKSVSFRAGHLTLKGRIIESDTSAAATGNRNTVTVAVDMPDVVEQIRDYGTGSDYFVNTGSPHHIQIVQFAGSLEKMDVVSSGRKLRHDVRYDVIGGTNVDFVEEDSTSVDDHVIRMRTFERGVENETLACGTGAVAAALVMEYRSVQRKANMSKEQCSNGGEHDDQAGSDEPPGMDVLGGRSGPPCSVTGCEVDGGRRHWHVKARGGDLTVSLEYHEAGDAMVFTKIQLAGPATRVAQGVFYAEISG